MSQSPKKLTVTFPLYMQHAMVERAWTALADQTFTHFKIVCLDDMSPQPFDELAQKFAPQLDITIHKNEVNLGAMKNIWKSIQLPTDTPYLLSHHADDFLKCDYLEKAVAILDTMPDVSFVVTGPTWVEANIQYIRTAIGDTPVDYFDAADFAKHILNFAPYIFGSVVYRTKDLVSDWKLEQMDTYADRYFMGEILRKHKTRGAYIHGFGIFEHDHTQDKTDNRSPSLHEGHAIALLTFYKELLLEKYPTKQVETIITNTLLYYYSYFKERSSLRVFYQKQRPYKLLQLRRLRGLGLYALLVLPLNTNQKRRMMQFIKKVRSTILSL
jgi:glycosyltransferase involved in cell wall biosynthesis